MSRGMSKLNESHRILAAMAGITLATALILGALSHHGHAPLSHQSLCASVILFGKQCPGCGLTRSFVAIGGGEVAKASVLNPLGPILFALFAAYLIVQLAKLAGMPAVASRWIEPAIGLMALGSLLLRTLAFYFL